MKYAKVVDGAISKIPYSLEDLKQEAPNTSFPKASLSNADIQSEFGIVEVVDADVDAAAIGADASKDVTAGDVTLIAGTWTQTWNYTDVPYNVKRQADYGETSAQIEYITENGLDAWQTKVAQIKLDHPKP